MESIITQQISAAIDALNQAKLKLASEDAEQYLNKAAAFIGDIQFNVMSLRPTQGLS